MTTAGFTFRFQRILELKEKREQALQLDVARLERSIRERQDATQYWMRMREKAMARLREACRQSDLTVNDQYGVYLEHLRGEIRHCSEQINDLEESRQKVRRELETIVQERKLLEQYRDRLLAEYAAQQEKAEERALDSYSIQKFVEGEATL